MSTTRRGFLGSIAAMATGLSSGKNPGVRSAEPRGVPLVPMFVSDELVEDFEASGSWDDMRNRTCDVAM